MLSKADWEQIEARIELGVRRYFDHYLIEIFPRQMKAHNQDCEAHGRVVRRLSRLKWAAIGASIAAAAAGLGSGAGLAKWLWTF